MPGFAFAKDDPDCSGILGFLLCDLMKFFNWAILGIAQTFSSLVNWLTSIVAAFIPVLLKLSANLAVNPLVKEGFRITLSVANLGFVLVIIVIAFATILRYAGYGFKDILWKLVVAALLINFSFAIAGVIIDFNNILGNYFIGAASPGNIENFSSNLANSLNVQKLVSLKPQGTLSGDVLKFTSAFIGAFIGAASVLIFSVVTLIAFGALAFMLLVRYLYLVFLLIVMPIVWLCWVFPNLNQYWKKWWSAFLKWNFFFPAVSFFIYLAIFSANAVGTNVEQNSQGLAALVGASTLSDLSIPILVTFLQIFVQVGLIFGGLIVAQKLGISGAAATMGMMKGFKEGFVGGKLDLRKFGKTAGQATGRAVARVPVVRTLLSPISKTIRAEKTKIRLASEEKSGAKIAADVKGGRTSLEQVRQKAGSKWRSFVPMLAKQRANNIMALAALEGGGLYPVGGGPPLEEGEWQNPVVSLKERKLIDRARERRKKQKKKEQGPTLEERLKKLETKEEKEEEKEE